ncbi:MAG: response regulator [Acidobacteriota bacterium]
MRNILLLDDDPVILEIMKNELNIPEKYSTFAVSNGVEGLEVLNSTKIDVIITDILMPEFDGIQLISYLQENQINIPVLVITSVEDVDIIDHVAGMGINNIFKKPIDFKSLMNQIDFSTEKAGTFENKIDLLFLCKLFDLEKRSTEISVEDGKKKGVLTIKSGKITFAEFESLTGIKALEKLFSLADPKVSLKGDTDRPDINISDTDIKEISKKFFNSDEKKVKKVDEVKLNNSFEKLIKDLGSGLLVTEICNIKDSRSVSEFSANYKSIAFSEFSNNLQKAIKKANLPEVGDYYMLSIKGDKLMIVLMLEDYQWGLLIDEQKVKLGYLLNVVLPELKNAYISACA